MSKRPLTPDLYDRLVDAFRDAPGNAAHAARIAGCDRRTAKAAYEKGWKNKPYAIAIYDVLQREKEELRARRMADEQQRREAAFAAREQSRQDALSTKVEEARGIANARRNAVASSAVISKVIQGLIPATDKLRSWLESTEGGPRPAEIPKIIASIVSSQRMVTESLRIAMDLERLRAGNPDDVINTEPEEELTAHVAVEQLTRLQRTLARAKTQGYFGDVEEIPDIAFDDDEDVGGPSGVH